MSHQLAIAKASFSAGLLRPDPKSIPRDDIAHFHTLLNAVCSECSSANIQKCKRWILLNVSSSPQRFAAFGKYLTALSTSFSNATKSESAPSSREVSVKRKRLHLLYLINDLLHHAKVHSNDASIPSKVQPFLIDLLGSAASFKNSPKHHRKLRELLDIWEERNYYSKDYIDKLRESARNATESQGTGESSEQIGDAGNVAKAPKSVPFVMPAMHGDPNTPWYDLPAGNLMPHIVPNSTRPINPHLVKPLQFVAGPADETLTVAVADFLRDVDRIFGVTKVEDQYEEVSWDIDELGQPILHDEITNDIIGGEGYYGWSKAFCEKMKRRRKGLDIPGSGRNDDTERRGRSLSQSSGMSSPPRNVKKRRYSRSGSPASSRSDSRSRSGHRRRSYSRSRSPSVPRSGLTGRKTYSRSPNRDGASRPYGQDDGAERNAPTASSYDSRSHTGFQGMPSGPPVTPNMDSRYQQNSTIPPPPPPASLYPPMPPFGPGMSHIPPPPPPPLHYQGQWPPPPPPPHMMNFNVSGQQQQQPGGWPAHPPPPPPPFHQGAPQWQSQQGQQAGGNGDWSMPQQNNNGNRGGGGGFRGRGRGGYQQQQQYDGRGSGSGSGQNGYSGNRGNQGRGW